MYRIGLDVGSTTAKIAAITAEGNIVYSKYERHNAKVDQLVLEYLNELKNLLGDVPVSMCVTGSVGMSTAEMLNMPFVQEVVAATTFARNKYPQAKALIDIGGEDAKVVFFNQHGTELRMNGNCAGGTGSFIDQMSALLGVDNDELNRLALNSQQIYPIAARCGVFAKTDIQNLMSRNISKEDIAASIFHSITVQTITTLSHGCNFEKPILFCGGPLTFLSALRKAFARYLNMSEEDFIVNENSNLAPAIGCALRCEEEGIMLDELIKRASTTKKKVWKSSLQPLFRDETEYKQWKKEKDNNSINVMPLEKGVQDVVLGIDSGSTTTKIIVLRKTDDKIEPVFTYYAPNLGNPIKAAGEGLEKLRDAASRAGSELHILGGCSTGYGEELIKAAYNLDHGIIETMAHYKAATSMSSDVSFILDIGGQDMKAIFVDHDAVVRMELNEACSSGCGTFIQTFANSLGYEVSDFASMACLSQEPCDLGTRCTVFMNSKVKQVMREGATVADISAGLSYSVIKNCLYKVLKLRGSESLGRQVVVQGGTMRNDAVVRAFELLTNTTVLRSNMPEMMGALGCALYALENVTSTTAVTLEKPQYDIKQCQCHGCENSCTINQYIFAGGNKFYSGNKCEKVFNNNGAKVERGENIYPFKYKLLFDRNTGDDNSRKIGIPRVLNMYEEYPFWNALLVACGFKTVLSDNSNFVRYEKALGSVMSDNICFPAKLVHSHIHDLEQKGVERILMPYVVYEYNDDDSTLNSYNCPIVSGYSDVIRSSMEPSVPVDSPVINFSNPKLLKKQIVEYLSSLGIHKRLANKAFNIAVKAQLDYIAEIKRKNTEIYEDSVKKGKLTILLSGRPYHTDPLIQHRLSAMIAAQGVNVINDDIVRYDQKTDSGEIYPVKQWAYINRIVKSAQWVADRDEMVHFVEMTSFGCGPDAFMQDEIRDILQRNGKPFTLLKIDDVSNIGSLKLRVRSLVESLNNKTAKPSKSDFRQLRIFHPQDKHRKILVPFFTEYISPLLPALFSLVNYEVEVLPPSDEKSVEYGLQYANNEICYPATLIVGDIIKALKEGHYDADSIAVAMSQTGGQCRATSYAGIIKRAMIANGFQDIPLVTIGVTTSSKSEDNEQEGFDIPWKKYIDIIVTAILYGDTISKMYHASVVREKKAGTSLRLRNKYLTMADPLIRANDVKGLMQLIQVAAVEFDESIVDKQLPQVGIVGEIFLKFHPFAHQYIEKHIMSKNVEIVPPLLAPFFLQEFVNVEVQKKMRLSCSKIPSFIIHGVYKQIVGKRMQKINKLASRFRYFSKIHRHLFRLKKR